MLGIFLDTETNGLDPFVHRILDIAYLIVDLSSGEIKAEYQSFVMQPESIWAKSNPDSLKINGFTYDMVKTGKSEKLVQMEILKSLKMAFIHRKDSVFICQNPSFDRVFFSQIVNSKIQEENQWPYHWLDLASMYWAIYLKEHKKIEKFKSFSKDMIAQDLNLPPENSPHRAMQGARHLLLCYEHLVGFPLKKP